METIPWNGFLGSLKFKNTVSGTYVTKLPKALEEDNLKQYGTVPKKGAPPPSDTPGRVEQNSFLINLFKQDNQMLQSRLSSCILPPSCVRGQVSPMQ